jgi:aspartate/methionine/tyrosine aminotransferase
MRERCVRIGSAGKTFSVTGWKVGYITAPPHLLEPIAKAHQFITFTTPPNLQRAVAFGLRKGRPYFDALSGEMQRKRNRFVAGLEGCGLEVVPCQGTYFASADIRSVGFEEGDVAFCRMITTQAGVAAVPVSAFYTEGEITNFVRFCFCKRDQVLDKAIKRLARFFK